jgi:hypothetical protein
LANATPELQTIPPVTTSIGFVTSNVPDRMGDSNGRGRTKISATHEPQTMQSKSVDMAIKKY